MGGTNLVPGLQKLAPEMPQVKMLSQTQNQMPQVKMVSQTIPPMPQVKMLSQTQPSVRLESVIEEPKPRRFDGLFLGTLKNIGLQVPKTGLDFL